MVSLKMMKMPKFARFPEVRSYPNDKVYYVSAEILVLNLCQENCTLVYGR